MVVRWTPSALNDLKIISRHIERQRNLATANRICRIIYDTIQILRRFPESGKPGIEDGTREFVVPKLPSYIVAYRVTHSEVVQILLRNTRKTGRVRATGADGSLT
jgi:addiction module RelE/StbE family toxin